MLTRPLWAVLAVTIAAGAGCSSGSIEHDDEHQDAAEDRSQWVSPLSAFLGLDPGGTTARERAAEQEVAACMRVAGFEYVPATRADMLPGELTSLADASAHGYGLTIHPVTDVDANEAAYEALPATERRRWDDALYGPASGGGTEGCLSQTGPASPEQLLQEALGRPEFLDLADRLAELETTIVTDQRVAAAGAEWSACMARVEFPDLGVPGDGFEFVLERAGRAVGVDVARDGFDTAWLDQLPDEELAELHELERSVASADVRCMEAYDRIEREVRTPHENEFVADHREALDHLRAAIQQP